MSGLLAAVLPRLSTPALASPAPPQLEGLLDGRTAPLTLQLKSLDRGWRRMVAGGAGDATLGPQALGVTGAVFYTRGETAQAGGRTYLLAYRLQVAGPDVGAVVRAFQGGQPGPVDDITPDAQLALALLDLQTVGDLHSIEPVDVAREIRLWHAARMEVQRQFALATVAMHAPATAVGSRSDDSQANLARIGQALAAFEARHDEVLPPLNDQKALAKLLLKDLGDEQLMLQPKSRVPFTWNTVLSEQSIHNFTRPGEMVIAYEATPEAGPAGRAVLLLDGNVRRVSEAEWKKLKKSSFIK